MPKVPEAPEVEPEPKAEAAVAERAGKQEGANEVDSKGNYSDAEILEWMRIKLIHADKIYDLKRVPNIVPTLSLHPHKSCKRPTLQRDVPMSFLQ